METTAAATVGTEAQQHTAGNELVSAVDADTFLELLLTELQNQDPLEPMSNAELVKQLSQIWELQSNMELTETLESVRLGQNLGAANGMLGRLVAGLNEDSESIVGRVDGVSIADGKAKLYVGESMIDLENVSDVFVDPAGA